MRLTVRNQQMEVMAAVAETNFERRIADHLREHYADSIVRLPDGSEFRVAEIAQDKLEKLVTAGIAKARAYELANQSSIASFVALMFSVSPNFDEHRLCGVLLGDEEKVPDDRVAELPKVLSEKNWEAIRKDYNPNAWADEVRPPENDSLAPQDKADTAKKDPMSKTMSGATMSRSIGRKRETIGIKPESSGPDPNIGQETVKIDRKQ